MILSGLWFQFVAADSSTDQAQAGFQNIVSRAKAIGQSIQNGIQEAIVSALATAQKALQSLQDRFKDSKDQLTSAYSNDTSSASQVKACVQNGQQEATAVINSTSTRSNIISVLTAALKYALGHPIVYTGDCAAARAVRAV
jgi:hypothetical protein